MRAREWYSLNPAGARLGAIALLPIATTALVVLLMAGDAHIPTPAKYVLAPVAGTCYLCFSAAVLVSFYSVAFEKSKIFGVAGIVGVAILLWLQPLAVYFIMLIAVYLPVGVFALVLLVAKWIVIGRRQRASRSVNAPSG